MIINLTLVIQIVNFFIAYTLLRLFFFVPLLKAIDKEQQHQNTIDQILLNLEENIILTKKRQQKQLTALKAHFISNKPDCSKPMRYIQKTAHVKSLTQSISSEEIYEFTEKLKHILQLKLHI